jgi:hypothetical protein
LDFAAIAQLLAAHSLPAPGANTTSQPLPLRQTNHQMTSWSISSRWRKPFRYSVQKRVARVAREDKHYGSEGLLENSRIDEGTSSYYQEVPPREDYHILLGLLPPSALAPIRLHTT